MAELNAQASAREAAEGSTNLSVRPLHPLRTAESGSSSAVWTDLSDPDPVVLAQAITDAVHQIAAGRLRALPRHDDEPRPRLEPHGDYLFGVLVVPVFVPEAVRVIYQEVDLLASRDRLITVCKTPPGGEALSLDAVRAYALGSGATPGMCLYHLVDEVAERYLTLVDAFAYALGELEDNLEKWPAGQVRERISRLRHDVLRVRRVLAPTRDAVRFVLDDRVDLNGEELFPREVEIHFADAYDKLLRAADGLDVSRELLAGVRDYHQAQVANDQNAVMKRLTVIASILLLPTFIVGLYGQNVHGVPEYQFHYGYAWSWGLIVTTTICQLVYFRRQKWI
jgi:magnesium/cobalt transport protein CorA